MKITNPLIPYIPYHVKIGNKHRIIYFKQRNGYKDWYDWFSNAHIGIGQTGRMA